MSLALFRNLGSTMKEAWDSSPWHGRRVLGRFQVKRKYQSLRGLTGFGGLFWGS